MTTRLLSIAAMAAVTAVLATSIALAGQPAAIPDVLKESIAYYATLTSYADTGTVRQESPGIVEESKFTTYFRRPARDLYFDFQAVNSRNPVNGFTIDLSAYRTVIWMAKGNMESYDFYQKAHKVIPAGAGQVQALQIATSGTRGTSILVPSLLYSQAGLASTIRQIESAQLAGTEEINKVRCYKVTGIAAAYYRSGNRTNERPVTVWIDAQTKLIRRVFEDTPKGYQPGSYSRLTTTLEPRANPVIDDAKFQFTAPATAR